MHQSITSWIYVSWCLFILQLSYYQLKINTAWAVFKLCHNHVYARKVKQCIDLVLINVLKKPVWSLAKKFSFLWSYHFIVEKIQRLKLSCCNRCLVALRKNCFQNNLISIIIYNQLNWTVNDELNIKSVFVNIVLNTKFLQLQLLS